MSADVRTPSRTIDRIFNSIISIDGLSLVLGPCCWPDDVAADDDDDDGDAQLFQHFRNWQKKKKNGK